MIDWKRKLSSRKFWMALIGFVSSVMGAMRYADQEIAVVTSIIMAGAVLIAYILAEGFVDANQSDVMLVEEIDEEPLN